MPTTPIIPEVIDGDEKLPADLVALRRFSQLMDNAVEIPGTTRRVGLDPIIGLIPGMGDVAGAFLGIWIISGALRHRVPLPIVARMIGNLLVDLLLGLIPVAGDVLDFFFKGNLANVGLLIQKRDRSRPPRSVASIGATLGCITLFILGVVLGALALIIVAVTRLREG